MQKCATMCDTCDRWIGEATTGDPAPFVTVSLKTDRGRAENPPAHKPPLPDYLAATIPSRRPQLTAPEILAPRSVRARSCETFRSGSQAVPLELCLTFGTVPLEHLRP